MEGKHVLTVAVVGLMITNIVVIVKLHNLQSQADGIVSKIDNTVGDVKGVLDDLKRIFG